MQKPKSSSSAKSELAKLIFDCVEKGTSPEGIRKGIKWTPADLADPNRVVNDPETETKRVRRWYRPQNGKTSVPSSSDFNRLILLFYGGSTSIESIQSRIRIQNVYDKASPASVPGPKPTPLVSEPNFVGTESVRWPGVYLSIFDLQHDQDVEDFTNRSENWYLQRMFIYGAIFRFVAFQWSSGLKNANAGSAFLRLQDCFERNEMAPDGIFKIHASIQSFRENIIDRFNFFSPGYYPLERIAYEKSNAIENSKHLDRQLLRIHAATSDVRDEISQRVTQFIIGSDLKTNDERKLIAHAQPDTYQTNLLNDQAKMILGERNVEFQDVLGETCRREYNRANAITAKAICDFDHPNWGWSTIFPLAKVFGISSIYKKAVFDKDIALPELMFMLRTNESLSFLRDQFFLCQTKSIFRQFYSNLVAKRNNFQIENFNDCLRMWDVMRDMIIDNLHKQ